MKTITSVTITLAAFIFLSPAAFADDVDYLNVTILTADALDTAMAEAPADRVSDQPMTHVESAEGRLGVGVVHRPLIAAGGPVEGIRHHKQSEVYRVMAGSGTLVTSKSMTETNELAADGFVVTNLTGPSDVGVIVDVEHSQVIGTGDIVIIPAGLAHGFSEITEEITYMVVRVDPERLVALK
jgi:mannose-6-phosphate isomerase-like protein (cupin superfamily)